MRKLSLSIAAATALAVSSHASAQTLDLCYDVVAIGGGLFEYTFVCETDAGWAPGMGWRWYIFGDQMSAPSPMTGVSMTSAVPGPWTMLASTGGFHNGPTFAGVLDYWIPITAGETLVWSCTSTAVLLQGDLLFSTIAGTIGGAVAPNFKVATQGCPSACPCACDWDPDPVCDIFDFLAFQNGFVNSDPCACGYDPDPACDIFDFLAFLIEFVIGCP
ncbi:MAG: hypothetical protein IH985_06285 [Planctomycetes bacterium]|nr:hypothetical protein [Planctomycetota bacterium]